MVDIKEAFTFQFKDDNWIVKILIGTVLNFIPIANLFSMGYAYLVFKKGVKKESPSLPEWDDWGDLFLKGLLLAVIAIIYLIIPGIILGIGSGITSAGAIRGAQGLSGGTLMSIIGGIIIFGGGLIYFIVSLILPGVYANYANNDEEFSSIFQFLTIIKGIFAVIGDYLIAIVIGIVVGIVCSILCVVFIGFIIVPIASFYLILSFAALYGMVFSGAFGAGSKAVKKA